MSYVQKEGQGSLFKNDRKEKESHPDYKGSIMVDGVEYWVSAWIKRSEGKAPFMSLSAQPKEKQQEAPRRSAPPPSRPQQDMDDDIPF